MVGKERGQRDQGVPEFGPLSGAEKGKFPHAIYHIEGNLANDQSSLFASFLALRSASFPLAIDVDQASQSISVRTSSSSRDNQRFESALMLGLTGATQRRLQETVNAGQDLETATHISTDLLSGFQANREVFEAFRKYYEDDPSRRNKERFISQLFSSGTDYDPELFDHFATETDLEIIIPEFGPEASSSRAPVSREKRDALFERFPHREYTRLYKDEAFHESPEGQELEQAYARACGNILGRKYGSEMHYVTVEGHELLDPQIPLSRFPIIEALAIEQATTSEHRFSDDSGSSSFTLDTLLHSDSTAAHKAAVNALTERSPEVSGSDRHLDNFSFRRDVINGLIRQYQEVIQDEKRRALLMHDISALLDAYVGESDSIVSARTGGARKDMSAIRKIASDLIPPALSSPDPELTDKTEEVIATVIPATPTEAVSMGEDSLPLDHIDLVFALFDSISSRGYFVREGSRPEVFGRVAANVFGDPKIAMQFYEMSSAQARADAMKNSAEALKIFGYWLSFNSGHIPAEAQTAYSESVRPSEELLANVTEEKNALLVQTIEDMPKTTQDVDGNPNALGLFRGLVNRTEFDGREINELPDVYHDLMIIASDDSISEELRGIIFNRIAENLSYIGRRMPHLLGGVVLDMYKAALGPVDNLRIPTEKTSGALYGAGSIVSGNPDMFEHTSVGIIEELQAYRQALRNEADVLISGKAIADEHAVADEKNPVHTLRNIKEVTARLDSIGKGYDRYLQLEEIRSDPLKYYPWMLGQFRVFYQQLGLTARDEADGSPVSNFYQTMKNAYGEMRQGPYPDSFDIIEDGNVEVLLKEIFDGIYPFSSEVTRPSVREAAIRFYSSAEKYMPESIRGQIISMYPDTRFADHLRSYQQGNNVITE